MALKSATDFTINRYRVDLTSLTVRYEKVACEDLEDAQGFDAADYGLPAEAHRPMGDSNLPHFNTVEWFDQVRAGVMEILDERAAAAGFL